MMVAVICAFGEVSRSPSYYRGEQYDPDLGLYYLRARYYNPATGRFMSRDPLAGHAQLPMTLHKYLYASGNPVNRIDPRGLADLEQETVVLSKAAKASKFFGTIGCVTSIGFLAGAAIVDPSGWWAGTEEDPIG